MMRMMTMNELSEYYACWGYQEEKNWERKQSE